MPDRKPIRVLLVDDEPLARQRVEDLLRAEEGAEIVASVDNGAAAVDAVRTLHPDLVFLDVQMPGKTGLDVVREIGADEMPATIFVTAYDRYALQAFDLAAVDYLVKPFDDERFEQAFRRARRHVELEEMGELRERLLAVLDTGPRAPTASNGPNAAASSPARAGTPMMARRAKRKVDNAFANPGTPVDNAHYHRLGARRIGYANSCAERQVAVSRRHGIAVESGAAGCFALRIRIERRFPGENSIGGQRSQAIFR